MSFGFQSILYPLFVCMIFCNKYIQFVVEIYINTGTSQLHRFLEINPLEMCTSLYIIFPMNEMRFQIFFEDLLNTILIDLLYPKTKANNVFQDRNEYN